MAYLARSPCSASFSSPPAREPGAGAIIGYTYPRVPAVCSGPRLAASRDSEGVFSSPALCLHLSPLKHRAKWPLSVCPLWRFFAPKGPPPTEITPKPVSWRQSSASIPTWSKQASMCPGSLETRCPLGYPSDKTAPRPPVAASRGEGCCGLGQGFPR